MAVVSDEADSVSLMNLFSPCPKGQAQLCGPAAALHRPDFHRHICLPGQEAGWSWPGDFAEAGWREPLEAAGLQHMGLGLGDKQPLVLCLFYTVAAKLYVRSSKYPRATSVGCHSWNLIYSVLPLPVVILIGTAPYNVDFLPHTPPDLHLFICHILLSPSLWLLQEDCLY